MLPSPGLDNPEVVHGQLWNSDNDGCPPPSYSGTTQKWPIRVSPSAPARSRALQLEEQHPVRHSTPHLYHVAVADSVWALPFSLAGDSPPAGRTRFHAFSLKRLQLSFSKPLHAAISEHACAQFADRRIPQPRSFDRTAEAV
jgi:hypothetical protein